MSSRTLNTTRLDVVMAEGTDHGFTRIRLADGHALLVKARPGAHAAQEVLLSPGLSAPDIDAWANEDAWEEWLTGGKLGADTGTFLDVPTEALRDLIGEHGGEHEDQEGEDPAPSAEGAPAGETAQDLRAELADLHGAFEHGYGADDIRCVFGRISDAGGLYLVCVWDFADDCGFGGNSVFYAEDEDGNLYEIQPDIHRWLAGEQETPGPLATWVCAPVLEPFEFAATDDRHNYARTER